VPDASFVLHVRYGHIVYVQAVGVVLRRLNAPSAVLPPGHALALDDVPRARRRAVVYVDLRGGWDR
jgi:hypothetical protein